LDNIVSKETVASSVTCLTSDPVTGLDKLKRPSGVGERNGT
jgi:hypothetical protein